MSAHHAACSCGQLQLTADGEPVRISLCYCLACQRRTGSTFGYQARFPAEKVHVTGRFTEYVRSADDGSETWIFRFCPECGSTAFYSAAGEPEQIGVPIGAFADPSFPPPTVAVFESRRHSWLPMPDSIVEHHE